MFANIIMYLDRFYLESDESGTVSVQQGVDVVSVGTNVTCTSTSRHYLHSWLDQVQGISICRTMTIVRLRVPAGEECGVGVVEALLGQHAAGALRLVTPVQHLQNLPAETANKQSKGDFIYFLFL